MEIFLQKLANKNFFIKKKKNGLKITGQNFFHDKKSQSKVFFLSILSENINIKENISLVSFFFKEEISKNWKNRREFLPNSKSKTFFPFKKNKFYLFDLKKTLTGESKCISSSFFFIKSLLIFEGDLSVIDLIGVLLESFSYKNKNFQLFFLKLLQKFQENLRLEPNFRPKNFSGKLFQKFFSAELMVLRKRNKLLKFFEAKLTSLIRVKAPTRQFVKRHFQKFTSLLVKIFLSPLNSLNETQLLLQFVEKLKSQKYFIFSEKTKVKFFPNLVVGHHIFRFFLRKILAFSRNFSFFDTFFKKINFIIESLFSVKKNFSKIYHWIHPRNFTQGKKLCDSETQNIFFSINGYCKFRFREIHTYSKVLEKNFLTKNHQNFYQIHFSFFQVNWLFFKYFLKKFGVLKKNGIFSENFIFHDDVFGRETCFYIEKLKKKLKKKFFSKEKLKIKKKSWFYSPKLDPKDLSVYEAPDIFSYSHFIGEKSLFFSVDFKKKDFHLFSFKICFKNPMLDNWFSSFPVQKNKENEGIVTSKTILKTKLSYCFLCSFQMLKGFLKYPFIKSSFEIKNKPWKKFESFMKKKLKWKNLFFFFLSDFFSLYPEDGFFSFVKNNTKSLKFNKKTIVKNSKRTKKPLLIFFSEAFKFLKLKKISISERLKNTSFFFSFKKKKDLSQKYKYLIFRFSKGFFKNLYLFKDTMAEILKHQEKESVEKKKDSTWFKSLNFFPLDFKKRTSREKKSKGHTFLAIIRIEWNRITPDFQLNFLILKNPRFSSLFSKKRILNPIIYKNLYQKHKLALRFENKLFLFFLKSKNYQIEAFIEICLNFKKEKFLNQKKSNCIRHSFFEILSKIPEKINFFYRTVFYKHPNFNEYLKKNQSQFQNLWLRRKRKPKGQLKFLGNFFWLLFESPPKSNILNSSKKIFLFWDFFRLNPLGDLFIFYFFGICGSAFFFKPIENRERNNEIIQRKEKLFLQNFPLWLRFSKQLKIFKWLTTLGRKNFLFGIQKKIKICEVFSQNFSIIFKPRFWISEKKVEEHFDRNDFHFFKCSSKVFFAKLCRKFESGLFSLKNWTYIFIVTIQFLFKTENLPKEILEKFLGLLTNHFSLFFILKWVTFQEKSLRRFRSIGAKNFWPKPFFLSGCFYFFPILPGFLTRFSIFFDPKKINFKNFGKILTFFNKNEISFSPGFLKKKKFLLFFCSSIFFQKLQKKKRIFNFLESLYHSKKPKISWLDNLLQKIFFNLYMKLDEQRLSFIKKKIFKKKKKKSLGEVLELNFLNSFFFNYLGETSSKIFALRKNLKDSFLLYSNFFSKSNLLWSNFNKKESNISDLQSLQGRLLVYTKNPYFFSNFLTFFVNCSTEKVIWIRFFLECFLKKWENRDFHKNIKKKVPWIVLVFFFSIKPFPLRSCKIGGKLDKIITILADLIRNTTSLKCFFFREYLHFFRESLNFGNHAFDKFQKINILIISKFKPFLPFPGAILYEISFRRIIKLISQPSKNVHGESKISFRVFFGILMEMPNPMISFQKRKLKFILFFSQKALISKNLKIQNLGVFCLKNIIIKIPKKKISLGIILRVFFLGISSNFRIFRENCNIITLIYFIRQSPPFKVYLTFFKFQSRCLLIKNPFIRFNSFFSLLKVVLFFEKKFFKKITPWLFFTSFFRFLIETNKVCSFLAGLICKILLSKFSFESFLISQMKCSVQKKIETETILRFFLIFFSKFTLGFSKFTKGIQVRFLINILYWYTTNNNKVFSFFPNNSFPFWRIFCTFLSRINWINHLPFILEIITSFFSSKFFKMNHITNKPFRKNLNFLWKKFYPENFLYGQKLNNFSKIFFSRFQKDTGFSFLEIQKSAFFFKSFIQNEIFLSICEKKKANQTKNSLVNAKKKNIKNFWRNHKNQFEFFLLNYWFDFIYLETSLYTKNFSSFFDGKNMEQNQNFNFQEIWFIPSFTGVKVFFFLTRLKKLFHLFL